MLHPACRAGKIETVDKLVAKTPDLNPRNRLGKIAFNVASEAQFAEIADYLTQHGADRSPRQFPELRGPYLGQVPPDTVPHLFAKGTVSTRIGMYGTIVFSPSGEEAFWKPELPEMLVTKMKDGVWNTPRVFPMYP